MSDFTIRPIAYGDAGLVAEYYASLSEATKAVFPGYPFTAEEANRLAMLESNHPAFSRFIVMAPSGSEESPKMVGTVYFWQWDRKVPWLGISITDAFQGQGLGRIMIQHAVDQARKFGKGGILLTTHKTNKRGQMLYKRHGFETIGQDDRGEILMILNFRKE